MKKKTSVSKKLLSLLLALLFAVSLGIPALEANAAENYYPVIYVYGRSTLYKNISTDNPQPMEYSTNESLTAAVKKLLPYAYNAIVLGMWDDYNNKAYDVLMDMFQGFALDKNGEVKNDTGVLYTWSEKELSTDPKSNNLSNYHYEYDARLSPLEIADDLNRYIEAVKRVTGAKKVSIVARCLGTNEMFAYLYKYQEKKNYSGIDSIVLYDNSLYGVDILDAAMGGKIVFEADALSSFLGGYTPGTDAEALSTILSMTFSMLKSGYGLGVSSSVATNFYAHIRDGLAHKLLKNTYGTCPGFWSMVYDNYEEAKEYIFNASGDVAKYAVLIQKIDTYRKTVQLRIPKMIADMQRAGVNVAAVCKYGFQTYPLCEDAFRLSDNTTALRRQSIGAACSKVNSTLGTTYILSRTKAGYDKYISPDEQVDSSTGLLPDLTWYIKNNQHAIFPTCIEPLIFAICRNHITVSQISKWPQYMVLQGSEKTGFRIVPMTKDNCDPRNTIVADGDLMDNPSGSSGNGNTGTSAVTVFARLIAALRLLLNIFTKLIGA